MPKDSQNKIYNTLPLIALRGLVLFPAMVLHFDAGRDKSIAALNAAMQLNKEILLVSQKDILTEDPGINELHSVGCTARIRQMLKVNGDEVRVLVEGVNRVSIESVSTVGTYNIGEFSVLTTQNSRASVVYKEAVMRHIKALFEDFAAVAPKISSNVVFTIRSADNIGFLSDYIASNLPLEAEDKQQVLEQLNPVKRGELVAGILERENKIMAIDIKISDKVKSQMDENQRDYYMREQVKALNEELYGETNPKEETDELREKIKSLNAENRIKEKLLKETDKLEKMQFGAPEATVIRNYIDACIELPWGSYTKDNIKLKTAEAILNKEHYGLKNVKERIVEALAVHSLTGNVGGSILCLVGPPGVGKTSVAKSVAHAMGRKFQRISLGGVCDEAEIRGHRRTYIGAMPGRIIDAVKLAGSANPVILLDEIDKLGSDYKGDPSSALLEALDPEQNNTFSDHFIDMPFDLSKVLFLTTANNAENIPAPLLDRMEIIEIAGYTRQDKYNIAKKYLVKKQLKRNGLSAAQCKITNGALYSIIDYYTREAGVRKLEQKIGTAFRKAAAKIVGGEEKSVTITESNINDYLGIPRYRDEVLLPKDEVGVVNGLAWTQVGGTIMQLEASVLKGNGKLELTGSLGDVMRESAKTALSYVRSIADILELKPDFYTSYDFHINATEAAIPKDGPSAGVAIATALVSALTGVPIKRDVAMTGEISLLGRVLPIGGLKEKSMAAYTVGIKTVYIPKDNIPDLDEIDPAVKSTINFVPVENAFEVISGALAGEIVKKAHTIPQVISAPHKEAGHSVARQ